METSPIDEIKAKLDLVDIVREFVPLKKAGANWKANCPFHTEKTPSFMVSDEKQIWHCFGCAKGGDMFEFIKLIESVEFPEALRILASRAGVVLRQVSPQMQNEKTRLLELMDGAHQYFSLTLRKEQGRSALSYLYKRGLDDETIDLFGIGFASHDWDGLRKHLFSKGFRDQEMQTAGLVLEKRAGGYVDRFRTRIMFGIRDYNGNTVGFTGRLLPGDESPAGKYVNTPSTLLYDKSRILYNMDLAKHDIKKQDYAIVVEGQMDVIASYQAKTQNVIASSGTALTLTQLQQIARLTKNLMFAFDTDTAGLDATDRAVELALSNGFSVKVINIKNAKDPDECIRTNKKDWYEALKNAVPYMESFLNRTLKRYDINKIEEKKKATVVLLSKLICIQNSVEKEHWMREVSKRLQISEAALTEQLMQMQRTRRDRVIHTADSSVAPLQPQEPLERIVEKRTLALVFSSKDCFRQSVEHIRPEYFSDVVFQELYKKAVIQYNNGDFENFPTWKNNFIVSLKDEEKHIIATLDLLFSKDFATIPQNALLHEMRSSVTLLKKLYSQRCLRQLHEQIAAAELAHNKEEVNRLTEAFSILSQQLKDLL